MSAPTYQAEPIDRRRPVRWAYGLTTVPQRRHKLLPRTLTSLKRAGFDTPRLFVDGDRDGLSWYREFGLETTARHTNCRTYGTWILGLGELFIREPQADRYAMFQDDFVTCLNLRAYLDAIPMPALGYWNLYTFPQNQALCPPKHVGFYESNQYGRGAVALVFNRETVLTLLTSRYMAERPLDPHRGWKSVDGGVITCLKGCGWKEYVHNPSLVQHTGMTSSMGNLPHKLAESFRGEDFDLLSLLPREKQP